MKIIKTIEKIFSLFIIFAVLEGFKCLRLTQNSSSEWSPEKVSKLPGIKRGIVDTDNYVKDLDIISRIFELIMQLRESKLKAYTTFIIVPKLTKTYTSGLDKDIFSFAEEVSALISKNNSQKESSSIVLIFSVVDRLVAYRVGDEIRKIIDDDTAFGFLKNIIPDMKSAKYGEAAIKLLELSIKKIDSVTKPKPEINNFK
jgi:hypothetical protein